MAAPVMAGLPRDLDVASGLTLRVTALDPTTGSVVSGVKVGLVVFTVDLVEGFVQGGNVGGDWFLVPGPGA